MPEMDGQPRARHARSASRHDATEKSQRTRAQERADEIDISPTHLLAESEGLNAELAAARKQSDEYLAGLQRERAEITNFRRRTTEEREQWRGLASESLTRKRLAIGDGFARAIEAMPAGP